jgi:hypothetical protein
MHAEAGTVDLALLIADFRDRLARGDLARLGPLRALSGTMPAERYARTLLADWSGLWGGPPGPVECGDRAAQSAQARLSRRRSS